MRGISSTIPSRMMRRDGPVLFRDLSVDPILFTKSPWIPIQFMSTYNSARCRVTGLYAALRPQYRYISAPHWKVLRLKFSYKRHCQFVWSIFSFTKRYSRSAQQRLAHGDRRRSPTRLLMCEEKCVTCAFPSPSFRSSLSLVIVIFFSRQHFRRRTRLVYCALQLRLYSSLSRRIAL
jgi:hypothetical protein